MPDVKTDIDTPAVRRTCIFLSALSGGWISRLSQIDRPSMQPTPDLGAA